MCRFAVHITLYQVLWVQATTYHIVVNSVSATAHFCILKLSILYHNRLKVKCTLEREFLTIKMGISPSYHSKLICARKRGCSH